MKLTVYLYDPMEERRHSLVYGLDKQQDPHFEAARIVKVIRENGVWYQNRYWAPSSFYYADLEK